MAISVTTRFGERGLPAVIRRFKLIVIRHGRNHVEPEFPLGCAIEPGTTFLMNAPVIVDGNPTTPQDLNGLTGSIY